MHLGYQDRRVIMPLCLPMHPFLHQAYHATSCMQLTMQRKSYHFYNLLWLVLLCVCMLPDLRTHEVTGAPCD